MNLPRLCITFLIGGWCLFESPAYAHRLPTGSPTGEKVNFSAPGGTNLSAGTDRDDYWKPLTDLQDRVVPNEATGERQLDDGVGESWSREEISAANTGKECRYLTQGEKETVLYVNLARLYPGKFAELHVEPRLSLFAGRIMRRKGRIDLMTNEGASAVDECITAMAEASPVQALMPSRGLSRAARDHVADQGPQGATGHEGSDGTRLTDRIGRYGSWNVFCAENISYGHADPVEIVVQLLVDDGVPSRGHRENLLNPSIEVVGVAIGRHSKFGHMCVLDFAGSYVEKSDSK